MSALKVRPFHRDDRDQLTELVNSPTLGLESGLKGYLPLTCGNEGFGAVSTSVAVVEP
jgi:hypothetical protein